MQKFKVVQPFVKLKSIFGRCPLQAEPLCTVNNTTEGRAHHNILITITLKNVNLCNRNVRLQLVTPEICQVRNLCSSLRIRNVIKSLDVLQKQFVMLIACKMKPNINMLLLLRLSFLDPNREMGHQQRQLLIGPVVSNQARFCLDSCTVRLQVSQVSPFFSQYHPEDSIPKLIGPLKTHLFAGYVQSSPIYVF